MKPHSFKNKIRLAQKRSLSAIPVVATLVFFGLNTAAMAQAKPSSTTVKAPGAVLATPSPTPTPPVRMPGSVPASQPAQTRSHGAVAPALPPPTTGGTNAVGAKSTAVAGDVNQMTTQQFRALPSTATINYNGQRMTKAAFIEQRRKELRAHAKSLQTKADIKFKSAKADFQQQQTLDLAARNARVKAVAESYDQRMKALAASPAYSTLAKEANDIVHRYPSASPSEQVKLRQRAAELRSQLQKMEQDAAAGH